MLKKNLYLLERHSFGGANKSIFDNAKLLRKEMTEAEKVIWSLVRRNQVYNVKFRRQHPFNKYIIDFFSSSLMLAIELDGEYHFEPDQIELDKAREDYLTECGITMIRFTNDQVLNDTDFVMKEVCKKVRNLLALKNKSVK